MNWYAYRKGEFCKFGPGYPNEQECVDDAQKVLADAIGEYDRVDIRNLGCTIRTITKEQPNETP